jgi:hypothetical protein
MMEAVSTAETSVNFYQIHGTTSQKTSHLHVTFQALTAANMKMTAFWDKTLCSLGKVD